MEGKVEESIARLDGISLLYSESIVDVFHSIGRKQLRVERQTFSHNEYNYLFFQ